eukprot:gene28500-31656_t
MRASPQVPSHVNRFQKIPLNTLYISGSDQSSNNFDDENRGFVTMFNTMLSLSISPSFHGVAASSPATKKPGESAMLPKVVREDPGMEDPVRWWRNAQEAFLSDMQHQAQFDPAVLSLLLQRLVMVGMTSSPAKFGSEPEGTWAAAEVPWEVPTISAMSPAQNWVRPETGVTVSITAKFGSEPESSWALAEVPWEYFEACLNQTGLPAEVSPESLLSSSALVDSDTWRRSVTESFKPSQPGLKPNPPRTAPALHVMAAEHQSMVLNAYGVSPDYASRGADTFMVWLLSVVGGNEDLASKFLSALTTSPACGYIWPRFGEVFCKHAAFALDECLEHVLSRSEPTLMGAFISSASTPSHVVRSWISNCFYGHLAAEEARVGVALVIVMGPDYLVYLCTAILKAQERAGLLRAVDGVMTPWLYALDVSGFRVASYLDYMTDLEHQFRP